MEQLGTPPKPRVRETTANTGTGNLVLAGAKEDKDQAFLAAYGDGAPQVPYMIAHQGAPEWEEGLTTVQNDGSGNSEIVRGGNQIITASSNSGSAVSFSSGTKDVFSPLSSEQVAALFARTVPVLAPSLIAPADGATDIGATPTLDAGGFFHDYGKPHSQSQFQVASDSGFTSIVYDSGWISAAQTHQVPGGNLNTSTTYYWRARYEDADGQQSDWAQPFSFATASSFVTVYGLAQVSTGGGAGSWQWVDADGNNVTLAASDFDNHPVWGGVADATIDGQDMVKIPKFWFRVGNAPTGSDQAGNKCWWIGDAPFAVDGVNAEVHPAFMDSGAEIAQFYIGKYQAVDDPNATGTKAASLPGYNPLVSIDFPTMQTRCANRNNAGGVDGFMLWSMYQRAAIQMLTMIEIEGSDSQSLIGQGRVNESSAANVDATDVAQATYRGIVGLWGNVGQMVDGMEIDGNHVVSIWDRDGNQTWINTGVTTLQDNNGWQVTMHTDAGTDYDLADVMLPASVDGTEGNATFADYIYVSDPNEVNVAYHGGIWSVGSKAGLFFLGCSVEASYSFSGIGGRLAKV